MTVLLKGVKIEHFLDAFTADDNASRIDPGSASRWSVTIPCDISLKIIYKREEDRLPGQSMNPPGVKFMIFPPNKLTKI